MWLNVIYGVERSCGGRGSMHFPLPFSPSADWNVVIIAETPAAVLDQIIISGQEAMLWGSNKTEGGDILDTLECQVDSG